MTDTRDEGVARDARSGPRDAAVRSTWPRKIRVRDTGLHDDLGGLGQAIFTTSGQGYEKQEYVRADLAGRNASEDERRSGSEAVTPVDEGTRAAIYRAKEIQKDLQKLADGTDESPFARGVTSRLDAKAMEIVISAAEGLVKLIDAVAARDARRSDSEATPAQAKEQSS